jgi:hypothetical protein
LIDWRERRRAFRRMARRLPSTAIHGAQERIVIVLAVFRSLPDYKKTICALP